MNAHLRRTLLALAVMAALGASHAAAQGTGSGQSNAVSQARQALSGNSENIPSGITDGANLSGNVANGTSGNIGMNQAAGDANAQGNQAAIATSESSGRDIALAKTVATQSSTGLSAQNEVGIATASINGNAFQNASGNVGVNQAANSGNEQLNQLSIASAPYATQASAASWLSQASSSGVIANTNSDGVFSPSTNTATLSDDAFAGANGNVSVNQVSGLGNIQSNNFAVSASSNAANNATGALGEDAYGNGAPASFALAQGRQASTDNSENDNEGVKNNASISGNFGYGASGNAGVNQSSGDFNLQGNQATISALSAASNTGNVTVNAKTGAQQSNLSNSAGSLGTFNTATIDGNALQNVSGNVGVNQASGSGSEQLNQLSIATAPNANQAKASSSLDQASSNYYVLNGLALYPMQGFNQGSDTANLANNALAGATGNLGVNQSAGFGNLQDNSLAVSLSSNAQATSDGAATARSHANQPSSGANDILYGLTAGNASINGNAAYGVSGNVGVNQSSGDINLQGNQAAIAVSSALSGDVGSAHAKTVATQSSTSDAEQNNGSALAANIGDNAFRDASGNLGLNQASGGGNQQLNQLSIATARNAANVVATSSLGQALQDDTVSTGAGDICSMFGCIYFMPSQAATLAGEAMAGTNGNIGVNQAAGLGNAQSNSLAAAVSNGSDKHAGVTTGDTHVNAMQASSGTSAVNTASVNPNDFSTLGGEAGDNVSGNMGVNQASGNANAQGNQLAISVARNASDDAAFTFGGAAHAETAAVQSNSASTSTNDGPTEQATIADNAFRSASGNLGVNQAAGDGNTQLNQTSIAEVQNAAYATAVASLDQQASGNTVTNNANTTNTAQLNGNAFINASGNIGVNQAVGEQNMQVNSLSLAVSNR